MCESPHRAPVSVPLRRRLLSPLCGVALSSGHCRGRIRWGLALCAVLALIWAAPAPAVRAEDALAFVGDAYFAPIEFLDHGVARGLAVDTVKALAQAMGRRAEIRLMRWVDAQQLILDGEADAAAIMSLSDARAERFDFTTPVFAFEFSIFFRLEDGPMHRLIDLQGKRVGVINGGLTRQVLETDPRIELVVFDDYPQGFELLRSGEVDAMAGDKWVGAYTVQRLGVPGVGIAGEPFATIPAAIAVKKGNHQLLARLNEAIASLKEQGRLRQIYEDWSPETIVFLTRERLTRLEILGAALALALTVLGTISWIVTLRRQVSEKTRLLREARDGLEGQVQARTAELSAANRALGQEIAQRRQAQHRLQEYRDRLRLLASELSLTEERQRRDIATELHDATVQSLALAKIRLGRLSGWQLSPEQFSVLGEVRGLIDRSIQELRTLIFELSPPILYELGFEAAVEWAAERIQATHGLDVTLQIDDRPKPLAEDLKVALFQAVRELLANVVKHSGADRVRLEICRVDDRIRIRVQDNGRGFTPAPEGGQVPGEGGFGLFNIRERLGLLGASIDVESEGEGTRITINAPLALGAEDAA